MKTLDTLVVIADAGHLAFYKTNDRGASLQKVTGQADAMPNPPSREHKSERPGRSINSTGARRAAIEPRTDPHQKQEHEFAAVVAEQLITKFNEGNYRDILIFSPPVFLGDLRKKLNSHSDLNITASVDKDLAKSSLEEIREHVQKALFPGG